MTECGGGDRGLRGRRRRAPGPLLPAAPTAATSPRRAGSTCSRSTSRAHAPRVAEEAVALLTRARLPARRSGRSSCTASRSRCRCTSRSATRSSSTASCSARPPTPARAGCSARRPAARCATAPSSCTSPPTPRCRAAWAPSAGTTRACAATPHAARSTRGALRAALSQPRVRRRDRPRRARGGCARAEGFARQPIVRMTNVSLEPGRRRHARRPDRRHRRRAVPRDQPLLVDRRPPPAVPVRQRGRPRDPRRRARAAATATRSYAGHHAAVLGLAGRRRARAPDMAAVGADELRQGRARAGHGRLARRRAGALPRRPGRRRVTA